MIQVPRPPARQDAPQTLWPRLINSSRSEGVGRPPPEGPPGPGPKAAAATAALPTATAILVPRHADSSIPSFCLGLTGGDIGTLCPLCPLFGRGSQAGSGSAP